MDELIFKYFRNKCSVSEKEQFYTWIEQNEENRKYFLHLRQLWDLQVLADKSNINLLRTEMAYGEIVKRLKLKSKGFARSKVLIPLLKYAAVFALLIATTLFFYFTYYRSQKWVEIIVPVGERKQLTLPDRTVVYLNSSSSFSYPDNFGHSKRSVKLNGEGYFEVQHQNGIPFEVETEHAKIIVTGTKFNLYAYNQDSTFEAALLEGKIEFLGNEPEAFRLKIKPRQKLIYNTRSTEKDLIDNIDPETAASWISGIYDFSNITFGELMQRLEKLYNVKFKVQNPSILGYGCTGKFRQDENILDILKVIAATSSFNYKTNGNEIIIY